MESLLLGETFKLIILVFGFEICDGGGDAGGGGGVGNMFRFVVPCAGLGDPYMTHPTGDIP